LATSLENVRKTGNRKLIIDLRGNAGGDVDEAITSADELLTSGMITSVEGRKVDAKKWQADRNTAYDGDLEVLTDGSTASGAEIFAAAIHGNQRGKVVGVTTYGKSIVQRFIPLASGGGVYMTVAHYTTPDMKAIKAGGIRPDVVVDLTSLALRDPEAKSAPQAAAKPKDDLILQKALQLFNEPAAKKAA
jgi:carboxyl-terminal processing protease